MLKRTFVFVLLFTAIQFSLAAFPETVKETQRDIPVVDSVDVVVVGGSTGGVSAALAARQQGAEVFLVGSKTYLGDDMCSTYQLWLEEGEEPLTPLAEAIYTSPYKTQGLEFSYSADKPSIGVHKDTNPPSMLTDGHWQDAVSESVEFSGDVSITADLGEKVELSKIQLYAFKRKGHYDVGKISVFAGINKTKWDKIGELKPEPSQISGFEPAEGFSFDADGKYRYVRFDIAAKDSRRLLLGEIVIEEKDYGKDEEKVYATPRPMHVKRTLEHALLDAGVRFVFSSYPSDIVISQDGEPVGVCIVNRSGRQIILCKTIIDATENAALARMAGADVRTAPAGTQRFKRVVIGGKPVEHESIVSARVLEAPEWKPALETVLNPKGEIWKVGPLDDWDGTMIEYTLELDMPDESFKSFAQAEQKARWATWSGHQFDASPYLAYVPKESIVCRKQAVSSGGADTVSIDSFRPEGVDRLFIVGGCADIDRIMAASLLRPVNLMLIGEKIGKTAAQSAFALKETEMPEKAELLPQYPARGSREGDLKEVLTGLRKSQTGLPRVTSLERNIPILGKYDVVVVGGGTGGAPAAISSAREGMRTLVVEYQHGLGGVGTLGLIGIYYFGNLGGFTAEIDEGVRALGPKAERPKHDYTNVWNVEYRMEWFRREILNAGGDIWFNSIGSGTLVENGKIKGVIVSTPQGRGIVLCDVAIDSTGSSDIAISAGADYSFTSAEHAAMQGTGMPFRNLYDTGKHRLHWYSNTDYTFVDDTDMLDVWRVHVGARDFFKTQYDLATVIDSRERRRIVGDYELNPLDVINDRTYDDTIEISRSNFDSHGFTIHPVFKLKSPDKSIMDVRVPYRCLLPKGLDNILVTGLGVSAHRDAMPLIRMEPDIQNQGYAAGIAASMAVKNNTTVRDIDVRSLQMRLVDKGCIPASVLEEKASEPISKEQMRDIVRKAGDDYDGVSYILDQPQDSLPLLKEKYRNAGSKERKLVYAHILGMMGEPLGADALIDLVSKSAWDEGWNFRGGGQFGGSMSYLDSVIIAMGKAADERAIEPLIEKTRQLDSDNEFSHHRAVAMAFESFGDPKAAKPLAELLQKEGMSGHTVTLEKINSGDKEYFTDRTLSLRELVLARALVRCGDYRGIGTKILKEYVKDLRGHYSQHALSILQEAAESE
ncbi:putative FAD-binding dehydrogenase [Limihaloglobus sulfuriphilus]|uniref:Putative FAD-binding dehydrogenase n=1 Tax=Limihaloglobus sulfuriphilus TaxID=1851148 RepID=A0A1Q2MDZ2_9BACT|nr:FAD-dependent oxidoreductase [Limihaloglobus sulfuriphilus]AQQ70864.1 putative FAD-binding dehydrogenase [Limihaloglobus sulfuriphilus]